MKNFPHFSIAKFISLGFLVLVFLLAYIYYLEQKTPNNKKVGSNKPDLFSFVANIQDYWEGGDFRDDLINHSCTHIPKEYSKFPEHFWSCNPIFIKCLLEGKLSKRFNSDFEFFLKNLQTKILPDGSFIIQHFGTSVKLQNSCHNRFLPEKVYSTGTSQEQIYLWDNYGRNIFIDRYYVNKFHSRLWKNKTITKIEKDDYKPELNLNINEMKKFCESRNKRLLETHVFDAASFFPSQYKKEGYLFKSKFPWGKGRVEITDEISWCDKVYTKECLLKYPLKKDFPASVSWIGIYNILGGEVEVFEQLFSTKGNLKLSSSLFPLKSKWHENGKRGTLKNDGVEYIDWNSNRSHEKEKLKGVAFRCMSIES